MDEAGIEGEAADAALAAMLAGERALELPCAWLEPSPYDS